MVGERRDSRNLIEKEIYVHKITDHFPVILGCNLDFDANSCGIKDGNDSLQVSLGRYIKCTEIRS